MELTMDLPGRFHEFFNSFVSWKLRGLFAIAFVWDVPALQPISWKWPKSRKLRVEMMRAAVRFFTRSSIVMEVENDKMAVFEG